MKRVVIVSKEISNDLSQMQNIIRLAGIKGGCQACCSGDPLEFRIEELELARKADEEVYRVDGKSGELVKA
jgi:hypothetical protein